ncbi:carbohydrate sulfotransferase 13-like [Hydractinia symbiolongicarpus]|uniref:carbohydrate sulfotransferase 13-like n=1 Tax=Hydractinia symbiolongicarpus TaxID=13093 RepID=UPI00254B0F54|nr:carbohydrate sulfotransferase 13-like [Hydractinia symbiolongicarpus]
MERVCTHKNKEILKLFFIFTIFVFCLSVAEYNMFFRKCKIVRRKVLEHIQKPHVEYKVNISTSYQGKTLSNDSQTSRNQSASIIKQQTTDAILLSKKIRMEKVIEEQHRRQHLLRSHCRVNRGFKRPEARQMLASDRYSLLYCSVPKVACTNWKRMFLVFEGKMKDMFSIKNKDKIHTLRYKTFSGMRNYEKEWRKNIYFSFMFVRHPFERLFSAYRNKFQNPTNPHYQRVIGSTILRLFRKNLTRMQYIQGKGVTFREFLQYILHIFRRRGSQGFDEHWQIMMNICSPCTMKYNFIGKMETLMDDAEYILHVNKLDNYKFPLNATDNYRRSASSLALKYFLDIPKSYKQELYEIYKPDFKAFGFNTDKYL